MTNLYILRILEIASPSKYKELPGKPHYLVFYPTFPLGLGLDSYILQLTIHRWQVKMWKISTGDIQSPSISFQEHKELFIDTSKKLQNIKVIISIQFMSILLLFKVLLPFNKIIHYVLYNFEIILCMLEFLSCVHISLTLLITFEQWVLERWYFTWVFLVIRPFRGYHYFWPCDLDLGVWPFFKTLTLLITFEQWVLELWYISHEYSLW